MRALRTLLIVTVAAMLAGCSAVAGNPAPTTSSPDTSTTTSTTEAVATTTTQTPPTTASTSTTTTMPVVECVIEAIGTDEDFYRKTCEQNGIAIVASDGVADEALEAAASRMAGMLAARPDLAAAVADAIDHIAVIGREEGITDLPDFEDLYRLHPGTDWSRLGRSFPGTDEIPVPAGAEENLLCLEDDRHAGEDMFVHDFAWTIRRFGIASADHALDRAIEDTYGRAIAAGLWEDTLAEVNSDEYWAEGAQSYFDANGEAEDDKDQTHNHVNTRDELREYDPVLYGLLVGVFGETSWRPEC